MTDFLGMQQASDGIDYMNGNDPSNVSTSVIITVGPAPSDIQNMDPTGNTVTPSGNPFPLGNGPMDPGGPGAGALSGGVLVATTIYGASISGGLGAIFGFFVGLIIDGYIYKIDEALKPCP